MLRTYLIIAAVSYLLGSIPFGYILVRIFKGKDIRASGSGNIGATNVARTAPGLGALTLLLDALKGSAAVLLAIPIAKAAGVEKLDSLSGMFTVYPALPIAMSLAALMAIVGHMFPVWLKFKGGKGVATAAGAFIVVSPRMFLITLIIFGLTVLLTRYVSLASIIASAAFSTLMFFLESHHAQVTYAASALSSLLIILKHHGNIRRLLTGTENRLVLKRKAAAAQLANED